MEVFHHLKKISHRLRIVFFTVCYFSGVNAFAADQYQLEELAKLPNLSGDKVIGLLPISTQDSQSGQYLLADETGTMSILIGTELKTLFDLPLNKADQVKPAKLTAFALHPSFSVEDQTGYRTFFTAHVEAAQFNNNIARLTTIENPNALPFDAVVTEWQLDYSLLNKTEIQHRREVMRIAVPTATHQIQQIAFNPNSKAWHDDYGIMHLALSDNITSREKASAEALYSGVILRINPAKFGLRNYMVPNNNPYLKSHKINNEIFILGAQKIRSFAWSKLHYSSLLIQHTYNGQPLLAIAIKGTDWRDAHQEAQVFPLIANQENSSRMLAYKGRSLKSLWGNILYLSHNAEQWQLSTLDTTSNLSADDQQTMNKKSIWPFNDNLLSPKDNVQLIYSHKDEPLLLDLAQKRLLVLVPNKTLANNNNQLTNNALNQADSSGTSSYGTLLLILFLIVISVIFYLMRPKHRATKKLLRNQFARFEMNKAQTTLLLYKRHQLEVDSQLDVVDIIESEVLLNNVSLNIINEHKDNGYNREQESKLRTSFISDHRHKLINDEIRQVHLYITDTNNKVYVICLYLRKGNQRLTKAKYFDVLESIIDWSWFIANQLNSNETEKRKIKVPANPQPIQPTQTQAKEAAPIQMTEEALLADKLHNIAVHDSEMINSLDKLVNLKQQGFLSDEEFSLAKANILRDITRSK